MTSRKAPKCQPTRFSGFFRPIRPDRKVLSLSFWPVHFAGLLVLMLLVLGEFIRCIKWLHVNGYIHTHSRGFITPLS